MTACRKWQDQILETIVGGAVPGGEVERHLAHCPACRRYKQMLDRALGPLVEALPPQEPPPGLRRAILAHAGTPPGSPHT